jgi:integrase
MTVRDATALYYSEVGQHHVNSGTTLVNLGWVENQLGRHRLLSAITDADIAKAVAKRRGEGLAPASVNRTVTEVIRKVMTRARKTWGVDVRQIDWRSHMLREPEERVREMQDDEEAALFAALRPDYHAIVRFALLSGCRMQECLDLTWRSVDLNNRQMRIKGKGSKTRTVPISSGLHALLTAERAITDRIPQPDEAVFTYIVQRADHAPRGSRLPIEKEGLKITFRRAVANAKVIDLHFHDLRHTCATRLLRATGNLRLVKDLLGHEDMKTTLKYAHVTTDDLRAAMNATENHTSTISSASTSLKSKG